MSITINRKKLVLAGFVTIVVLLLTFSGIVGWNNLRSLPPWNVEVRSTIDATTRAVSLAPEAVKKDLIARGLVIEERDASGKIVGGGMKCFDIRELIERGVYNIDEQGALQFATAPPSTP